MSEASEKKPRKEIDPVFKQLVVSLSKEVNFALETQVEVGRLPRTIDAVIRFNSRAEIERVQRETPFIGLSEHSQIEFKAKDDPISVAGYQYIRARTNLYMADHGLSAEQMSVTIVSSQTPHKLLFRSPKEVEFEEIAAGYYRSKEKPPVTIIATNRLPVEEKNYPLLLFASHKRKFRAVLQKMAQEGHWSYLALAYRLRPKITEEEISMFKDPYLTEDDLAFIAQDIGPQLLKYFKPEEVFSQYKPEEVLAQYNPKERVAGLNAQEVFSQYKPEEVFSQYKPEEVFSQYKPEEVFSQYKPEEAFSHYSLQELEAYLKQRQLKEKANGN